MTSSSAPRAPHLQHALAGAGRSSGRRRRPAAQLLPVPRPGASRIRILTVGTLAGILPFLIFTVLPGDRVGDTLAFIGTVPMIAVPLSFSYCIARYRVMQIEVLLKRSLVYSLLTGGLFLFYQGIVLGLGALLLRLRGQASQVATVAATLARRPAVARPRPPAGQLTAPSRGTWRAPCRSSA
jgi:hypothetical protein